MSKRLTTEEFIKKANKIHNYKYDYSNVIYIKSRIKIKITCKIHGLFPQAPADHLRGQGCLKCSRENISKIKSSNTEEFIAKANLIHNNKYDYSKVDYVNNRTKVDIICNTHGEFKQTPSDHLGKKGCKKCSSSRSMSNKDEFVEKSIKIHQNKYDYSLVEYKNSMSKVQIICNSCNDIFSQKVNSHLNGQGCPKCNKNHGYKKSQWINSCTSKLNADPKVYIIRCFNNFEEFIKIGITKNSIHRRFSDNQAMPYSYEVIKEIKGSPDFIWSLEKDLHKKYRSSKYVPNIQFCGKTECFNVSIIEILNTL